MPTLTVNIHLPTDARIPGELSTEHALSSYGRPVLLIEGQPYGLGDSFDPGWGDSVLVASTPLSPAAMEGEDQEADQEGGRLLAAWRGMCREYLARRIREGGQP